MVRQMLGWSGFVIGLAGMSLSAPEAARAEHDEHRELHEAAQRLQLSMTQFTEIACSRRLPPSDQHTIRTAKSTACALADSAHDGEWRTLISSYTRLRPAMVSIDHRLHSNYRLHRDHELWSSWANVSDDFDTIRWYLERRGGHRSHDDDRDDRDRGNRYWNDASRIGRGYDFDDHGYANSSGNSGVRFQIGSSRSGYGTRTSGSGVRVHFDPWRLP